MTEAHKKDRINFLRLLLIIGLVFLHYGTFPGSDTSPYLDTVRIETAEHPVATFVNRFFVFLFFSAVPLLGAISGYLFFKDTVSGFDFFLKRIRSRTFSILLPMISWCAIILALFMTIRLVSPNSPFLGMIEYDLNNFGFKHLVNSLVGITRRPIDFQFWFLHDLFLTVLCSPVLYLLLRKAPFLGLMGIGYIWLAGLDVPLFFRNDVLLFFYLGGLVRMKRWDLDFVQPRMAVVAMAVYVMLIVLRTVAPSFVSEDSLWGEIVFGPGTRALRLLGIVAFWGCAPFLMDTYVGRKITALGTLAFFLHSIHWPLNQFIKAGLAEVLPAGGEVSLLVNYFATTVLTLGAAYLVALALNAIAPSLLSHLSGGRVFAHIGREQDVSAAAPAVTTKPAGS